jgi:hypothetical protein
MAKWQEGQRVRLVVGGKEHGRGVIQHVGSTCLYCVDEHDNQFHSHTENFELLDDGTLVQSLSDVHTGERLVPRQYPPAFPKHLQQGAPIERRVIIGIAGRKGHGKDTAAQGLEGFENVKFAGPIKAMARAFFTYIGMDPATIDRVVDGDMKETPLACLGGKTGRYLQQVIGTEMGRNLIWDEIWINAAKMRADQYAKVAVTDLRFPNEGEAIKAWGGKRVRLVNPRVPVVKGEHPSEDLVDDLEVDIEVYNGGSIEDLHFVIRGIAEGRPHPGYLLASSSETYARRVVEQW